MARNPGLPIKRTVKQDDDHIIMTPELREHLKQKGGRVKHDD